MDNKLSELSKPVAWTDERGNLCTNRNKERGLESRYHQDYEKYTTPFYSQEYVSALLAELEAKDKTLELEREKSRRVMSENHQQAERIAELEATQMTGPLAMMLERLAALERITEGVDQLAIDGGWTARGMSEYAKSLEAKLATPVRLPDTRQSVSGDRYQWSDGVFNYKQDAIAMLRAVGFTVEGDEQ
ncbi:MAG: hypothetical protein GXW94_19885 [Serratia liquefaciens]|nr:hypothetical protein [Serratia liquefaciens]